MVDPGLLENESPMTSLLIHPRAQEPDPIATALHRVEPGDLIELGTSVEPFTRPETFIVHEVSTSDHGLAHTAEITGATIANQRYERISLRGPHDDHYAVEFRDTPSTTAIHEPPELVSHPQSAPDGRTTTRSTNYGPVEYLVLDT